MAAELAPSPKRNRTRSPSYPYVDLPTALEKAAILWKGEGKHPVAVNLAMQHWGYKEDSSTGYSCIAALKKLGLVDHEGIGETRQVRLSGLALTILLDNDPGSTARRDALRTAALRPGIHAELWERYGAELPSDQSLRRFLVLERSFNEAAVDELLEEYRTTMAFAGLHVGPIRGSQPAPPVPVAAAGFAPLPPIAPAPPLVDTPLPEPPPAAPRMPARAAGTSALAWNSAPPHAPASAPPAAPARPSNGQRPPVRQPSLFGDGGEENDADPGPLAEETLPPVQPARSGQERETGP